MTVEVTCPYCAFSRDVPEERIPPSAKGVVCPRCRQRFDWFSSSAPSPSGNRIRPITGGPPASVGAETEEALWGGVPWEDRSGLGIVQSIYGTYKSVLFSPGKLFQRMSCKEGLREPFAFGLLSGSLGGMFSLFWQALSGSGGWLSFASLTGGPTAPTLAAMGMMALIPFFVSLVLLIYSGVMHLLMLIVRGGGNGFEATFRVVSYSQAAQAWCIVPFVGGVIGGLWQVVVQIIGLQRIHQTTYVRVVVAFLLPVVFFTLLGLAIILPFLIHFFR